MHFVWSNELINIPVIFDLCFWKLYRKDPFQCHPLWYFTKTWKLLLATSACIFKFFPIMEVSFNRIPLLRIYRQLYSFDNLHTNNVKYNELNKAILFCKFNQNTLVHDNHAILQEWLIHTKYALLKTKCKIFIPNTKSMAINRKGKTINVQQSF